MRHTCVSVSHNHVLQHELLAKPVEVLLHCFAVRLRHRVHVSQSAGELDVALSADDLDANAHKTTVNAMQCTKHPARGGVRGDCFICSRAEMSEVPARC